MDLKIGFDISFVLSSLRNDEVYCYGLATIC